MKFEMKHGRRLKKHWKETDEMLWRQDLQERSQFCHLDLATIKKWICSVIFHPDLRWLVPSWMLQLRNCYEMAPNLQLTNLWNWAINVGNIFNIPVWVINFLHVHWFRRCSFISFLPFSSMCVKLPSLLLLFLTSLVLVLFFPFHNNFTNPYNSRNPTLAQQIYFHSENTLDRLVDLFKYSTSHHEKVIG